jgi:hypothetical protein
MPYNTEERLSAALHDIVGDKPFTPDFDRIEDRGRKLQHRRVAWRATAGTGFAVAAVAAVAVAVSGSGSQVPARTVAVPPAAGSAAGSTAAKTPSAAGTPLLQLVGYLTTAKKPAGDATLVVRDQSYSSGQRVKVYDLYGDNNTYYFAQKRSGLPAQVKGHHSQADGQFGREIAAAKYAATGDLAVARKRMASAPDPSVKVPDTAPGVTPPLPAGFKKVTGGLRDQLTVNKTDNWVWGNSYDALVAGAGNPTVRAGVLRLLSTLPEVKVKSGTVGGQPTLTLTAGKPALPGKYTESLTINASTGIPVRFAGGGTFVTVNYTVSRVSLADVAKGSF